MTNFASSLSGGLLLVSLVGLGCGSGDARSPAGGSAAALSAEPRAAYEELFSDHAGEDRPLALPTARVYQDDRLQEAIDLAVHGDLVAVLCGAAPGRLCLVDAEAGTITTPEPAPDVERTLFDPISIEPADGEPASFWAYDQITSSLVRVGPGSGGASPAFLSFDFPVRQAVVLDHAVAANGPFPQEHLRYLSLATDSDSLPLRVTSAAGRALFSGKPPEVSIHLNRNSLAADPERGLLVLAFLYVSRLHVYGPDGRPALAIAGPEEVELSYDLVPDPREGILRLLANDRTRLAYLDVAATGRAIFALFSGRDRQSHGTAAKYGNQIHVFSWQGRHLATAHTEDDLFRIAVGAGGGALYGIRHLPSEAIVELNTEAIEELLEATGRPPERRRELAR